MKKTFVLVLLLGFSGVAAAQVLPGGTPVIKASNGAVTAKVFEIDESSGTLVLTPRLALVTMEVNGENGIAVAYRSQIGFHSYYDSSNCTGTPHIDPASLSDPNPVELKFLDTPLFLTDGGGQTLYKIDPTKSHVSKTLHYIWNPESQTCIVLGTTGTFLEGEEVDQNFGTQFPPPYRLAVQPDPPASAMVVPVVGHWGMIGLALFIAWQGIRWIRIRRLRGESILPLDE